MINFYELYSSVLKNLEQDTKYLKLLSGQADIDNTKVQYAAMYIAERSNISHPDDSS